MNILLGKTAVPEFLQEALSPDALAEAIAPLLEEGGPRESMLREFRALRGDMAGPGFGERAAAEILARLETSPEATPLATKTVVSHAG